MHVFHRQRRWPHDPDARADLVVWALIGAVAVVNVLLLWRLATGGV